MSDEIRLSSPAVNCPDAGALARFYADITGGTVTFEHTTWATMTSAGGRIDFQKVDGYSPPTWPGEGHVAVHLDFYVDDLEATAARVEAAGATRYDFQPNAEHCLVFADPAGNTFCLTTVDEFD